VRVGVLVSVSVGVRVLVGVCVLVGVSVGVRMLVGAVVGVCVLVGAGRVIEVPVPANVCQSPQSSTATNETVGALLGADSRRKNVTSR